MNHMTDAATITQDLATPRVYHWTFFVHLWTLTGLAFAAIALKATIEGDFDTAARLLIGVLLVDFTDGTLARLFKVKQQMPLISGETIDYLHDLVGLTFIPMVFFWKAGLFLSLSGFPGCRGHPCGHAEVRHEGQLASSRLLYRRAPDLPGNHPLLPPGAGTGRQHRLRHRAPPVRPLARPVSHYEPGHHPLAAGLAEHHQLSDLPVGGSHPDLAGRGPQTHLLAPLTNLLIQVLIFPILLKAGVFARLSPEILMQVEDWGFS
jgi:hypothetical protein